MNKPGSKLSVATAILMLAAGPLAAREEWFRALDLEPALNDAALVVAARVKGVSETRLTVGGKGESALVQFSFTPVEVLKGVYSRDALSLTSIDLGGMRYGDLSGIQAGQLRLLILGRSSEGYSLESYAPNIEQAMPLLQEKSEPGAAADDSLVESARILLRVVPNPDRARRTAMLIAALRTQRGPELVPILVALGRRALLAAQTPGAMAAVASQLADPSPAVREQAAMTIHALLDADYLDQPQFRRQAVEELAASLDRSGSTVAPRVAALQALGAAGPVALQNSAVRALFDLDPPSTFAEQGARLNALGQLDLTSAEGRVTALLEQLPLDAPSDVETGAEWAAARLDPARGAGEILARMRRQIQAGLPVKYGIRVLGELPQEKAAPALLDAWKLGLSLNERWEFVEACAKADDPRLEPALAAILGPASEALREPGRQDRWWNAVEALMKIDTEDAARALEPRLASEGDLLRKLQLAEFLGRHGMRDGYPYAIEHMSEPDLGAQAIAALAAMRDPRAPAELRRILETSNDPQWNDAAIRALGRLGAADLAPRFLALAREPANPLAPAALAALGDLGAGAGIETAQAAARIARAGFTSRQTGMLTASAQAAGELAALPGLQAGGPDGLAAALRDQLAALLADSGAPEASRAAALRSLVKLDDRRLDLALARAVRDAGLEGSELLERIEKLLRQRKVKLNLT